MRQQTLASQASFEKYGRKSRRELFLEEMERVVPWTELESLVGLRYAKAGRGRRQPVGLSIMLRTYFVQQWFNLSDPGVEEALYDSASLRRFVGVDLGVAPAPDETTILSERLGAPPDPSALLIDRNIIHSTTKACARVTAPHGDRIALSVRLKDAMNRNGRLSILSSNRTALGRSRADTTDISL